MKSIFMWLFGFAYAVSCVASYTLGEDRGIKEVINACKYYNKYAIDGTEGLYCSVNPDPLTINIIDTQAGKKGNQPWKK